MRKHILCSPIPPTFDLFADHTNSLCQLYASTNTPFSPVTITQHVSFYQPPYTLLSDSWHQILPYLPSTQGLWGLVPTSFFQHNIKPISSHICWCQHQVSYVHPTYMHPPGAPFASTLFFIPPTLSTCQCQYLSNL